MLNEGDEEQHGVNLKDVISHQAKLLDSVTAPKARASIIWVIGEYSHRIPLIAPDVLRKLAKNFINEVFSDTAIWN